MACSTSCNWFISSAVLNISFSSLLNILIFWIEPLSFEIFFHTLSLSSTFNPFFFNTFSKNLFFVPPKATEDQEVHNEYLQYVNDVHWYAIHNLKSLYYLRSDAAKSAENVNVKIPRINLEDGECLSCEG